MCTNDCDRHDDYDHWSDGQRAIDGAPARGQAHFEGAPDTRESETESLDDVNDGGIMADTREDTDEDTDESEQSRLVDRTPEDRRDSDQQGLGDAS